MLSAIILAAGRSSRMGMLKQLLPFGKVTVIERIVSMVLDARMSETILVLGHRADEIEEQLTGYPINTVRNPDPAGDMLSSVQCGVRAASRNNGYMIVLGDQPLITTDMVNDLITVYEQNKNVFIIPVFEDKRGHPMIISSEFREELLSLSGGEGLKALRDRHPDAIRRVPVQTESMLADMDYYHEYEAALQRLSENK